MPVQCICSTCGKTFPKKPSLVGERNYCRRLCYAPPTVPILSDDGLTARIPLHALDRSVRAYALVDAADAEWLSQWRWSIDADGYAMRALYRREGQTTSKMHREILGLTPGDGLEGDHRNLDKLDNRRENLRILPKGKNVQNLPSRRGSSSPYRGVYWDRSRMKWAARVHTDGRTIHLGRFETEFEAAEAARIGRMRYLPFATD